MERKRNRCYICGDSTANEGTTYFSFPSDAEADRKRQWMNFVNLNPESGTVEPHLRLDTVEPHMRLCHTHFDKHFLKMGKCRYLLSRNAVPTLHRIRISNETKLRYFGDVKMPYGYMGSAERARESLDLARDVIISKTKQIRLQQQRINRLEKNAKTLRNVVTELRRKLATQIQHNYCNEHELKSTQSIKVKDESI